MTEEGGERMNVRKPEKDKKTSFLTIAMTDKEKRSVENKAKRMHISLSAYVRLRLFDVEGDKQ